MKPYYQKDSSYREIFYWLFELIPFLLPVLLLGSPTTTWFLTTLYLIFLLLKNGRVALIQCLKISNHVSLCWLIWALMTFLIQKISQVWEILLNYFFDFFFSLLISLSLSVSLSLSLSRTSVLNYQNSWTDLIVFSFLYKFSSLLLFFVGNFLNFNCFYFQFPRTLCAHI